MSECNILISHQTEATSLTLSDQMIELMPTWRHPTALLRAKTRTKVFHGPERMGVEKRGMHTKMHEKKLNMGTRG